MWSVGPKQDLGLLIRLKEEDEDPDNFGYNFRKVLDFIYGKRWKWK